MKFSFLLICVLSWIGQPLSAQMHSRPCGDCRHTETTRETIFDHHHCHLHETLNDAPCRLQGSEDCFSRFYEKFTYTDPLRDSNESVAVFLGRPCGDEFKMFASSLGGYGILVLRYTDDPRMIARLKQGYEGNKNDVKVVIGYKNGTVQPEFVLGPFYPLEPIDQTCGKNCGCLNYYHPEVQNLVANAQLRFGKRLYDAYSRLNNRALKEEKHVHPMPLMFPWVPAKEPHSTCGCGWYPEFDG